MISLFLNWCVLICVHIRCFWLVPYHDQKINEQCCCTKSAKRVLASSWDELLTSTLDLIWFSIKMLPSFFFKNTALFFVQKINKNVLLKTFLELRASVRSRSIAKPRPTILLLHMPTVHRLIASSTASTWPWLSDSQWEDLSPLCNKHHHRADVT